MPLLAADIGGTKTLLGVQQGDTLGQIRAYENRHHPALEPLLADYLQKACVQKGYLKEGDPQRGYLQKAYLQKDHQQERDLPEQNTGTLDLVLAIAGPVDGGRCQMTNLPWLVDAASLQQRFGFRSVQLLNDMEATAWAMPVLAGQGSLIPLRGGSVDFSKPVVVISVGTGLGEAAIIPLGQGALTVLPSEGGHKQFAPFDQHSSAILQQAFATGHGAISWENWFSGMGLPHLFQAIYPDMEAPGSNTITRLALAQPFSPSGECVRMFTRGLLAEAGNLALQHLAWGGVIFAGGVAQHLQGWLADKENQRFLALKSGHCERLQNIPLALCTDTQAALKGAAAFFKQQKSCGS